MELKPGMLCFLVNIPRHGCGYHHLGKVVTLEGLEEKGRWLASPQLYGTNGETLVYAPHNLKPINPDGLKDEEDLFSTKPLKSELKEKV